MDLKQLLNHDIACSCGRTHRCDIDLVDIGRGAIERLPESVNRFENILLVADSNTYAVCGERVCNLIATKIKGLCLFVTDDLLVPDEAAVGAVREKMTLETDLILGIGSGVINDICKYVSFFAGVKCGIVATAPSMDGFASSGAAMILGGMKVTETTHAPALIIGDTEVLKNAPAEMIRSGYADIIGKYSALNDWKLSRLINGEYLCQEVYDLVLEKTNLIRSLAKDIAERKPEAIEELMRDLVLIGVTLTLLSTTRPGSGSEHHLSHYFEITGLIEDKPYFLHGTDVGYSTIVTAHLRAELRAIQTPEFSSVSDETREKCYEKIYGKIAGEVSDLQKSAGRYANPVNEVYREKWGDVLAILNECPTAAESEEMLTDCGFDLSLFEKMYGAEKIQNGVWFAKDLKDRYSVLWLYFNVFFSESEAEKVL
ncbi:MAG: sn-glycerol-1-phosphate dehydrogenase [Clostridia bacterium]|nr:sn-glycerol-1-phosphate dehydrogenase [Clostridia bacterium]